MALEISYWSGVDADTRLCYGRIISSESVSIGATSTQSGAAPDGAAIARVAARDASCYVTNGSASPTASATNGVFMEAGDKIDFDISAGDKIAVIQS